MRNPRHPNAGAMLLAVAVLAFLVLVVPAVFR